MTSNLPESIIQKIMLYNSHPIADIFKASEKFNELNSTYLKICWICHDPMNSIDHICSNCAEFERAEFEEERRYNGYLSSEEEDESGHDEYLEEQERLEERNEERRYNRFLEQQKRELEEDDSSSEEIVATRVFRMVGHGTSN